MLAGLAAVVVGHTSCPTVIATLAEVADPADAPQLFAETCAKATEVLNKAESIFAAEDGKLRGVFQMYHGLSLLVPFNLRNADIGPSTHELIDKILLIPSLAAVPGLRAALIDELPQFFVLAENVAPTTPLLPWWFAVRHKLPTWYNRVLPEAVLMQPTSATCERVFSMMDWMFRDDQQAALQDYKETALMLRYNQQQRLRNAPAVLVHID